MLKTKGVEKRSDVRSRRESKRVSESLNARLAAYALAADAAGVGVLALAPPAQASILLNTTPIDIGVNTTEFLTINGVNELSFRDANGQLNAILRAGDLVAFGLNRAEVGSYPLPQGASVGPGRRFYADALQAGNYSSVPGPASARRGVNGAWANRNGYLAFKFNANSNVYFGWAHEAVAANVFNGETGVISSFAYETTPDTAIIAGQRNAAEAGSLTLSLLAMGALGLVELRRRFASTQNS